MKCIPSSTFAQKLADCRLDFHSCFSRITLATPSGGYFMLSTCLWHTCHGRAKVGFISISDNSSFCMKAASGVCGVWWRLALGSAFCTVTQCSGHASWPLRLLAERAEPREAAGFTLCIPTHAWLGLCSLVRGLAPKPVPSGCGQEPLCSSLVALLLLQRPPPKAAPIL